MAGREPTPLWESVERLLERVERPARYIDREWNVRDATRTAAYRVCLIYPDTYELGMANQAIGILYDALNRRDDVVAERCFVPWKDMAAAMREEGVPLFTLESASAVADCDMLGITLPHEMCYTNVLEILDLAGIPLRASERSEEHPLVVGGGPCAFNPEPVAPFFDAIAVGEGEEAVHDIVDAHLRALGDGLGRRRSLERLAELPGVYVPSMYTPVTDEEGALVRMEPQEPAPAVVRKRLVNDLDEFDPPLRPPVPYMDVVHDRATVEILRGCTRGCRFCQAGMVYRPVRERSADKVVSRVMDILRCTGYEEVSLTSLSSADHSTIEEVARRLRRRLEGRAVSISLPSSRADTVTVDLARLISSGRKGTLTFAVEAGTQRLRDVINKNVSERDLMVTLERVFEAGWRKIKLYFMIGLPTETEEDVRAIGALLSRVMETARTVVPKKERGGLRVNVSVSTFVPKAHTPFQWEPMLTLAEIEERQRVLQEGLPRGVQVSWHNAEVSFIEGTMARGGRELAPVVERAWREGATFAAWTDEFSLDVWMRAFESNGIDPVAECCRARDLTEVLPWDHISAGVSKDFLVSERERAFEGVLTEDCAVGRCSECGVCPGLGARVVLDGVRA
ncbi:MAG: TIGR03960 family B12-binding radical SAM protein [Coriobacteriia bacterium]